ncbi:unnamed protein product [Alopecurus aequalis]
MGATQVQCSSFELAEPREPWWSCRDLCWLWCGIAAACILLAIAAFFLQETDAHGLRHYSVAIDSVSGLDPATDLARRPSLLDPQFNLTLRVTSSGIWASECVELGMYVEVSYRGVPLASSPAMTEHICARPKNATEMVVIARGAAVVLPGSVLGSLTMEMRSGVQVFDVALRDRPMEMDSSCRVRVGDAGSLQREC